jgi:tellurite resistance protein
MFLNRLTSKQQKVFLSLATDMIAADNKLDVQEEAYLNSICNEMQLSRHSAERIELNKLHTVYTDDISKNILLIELTAVSYCDGNCAESERIILNEVAKALGISDGQVDTCSSLVSEFLAFQQKLNKFIG